MYNSPTPCQIWGGCCICLWYASCLPSLCCALQIQPDLWQKLRFKNSIKRIISGQTQQRYGKYTHVRSALSCRYFAWCCRSVQVDGTQLPPLPMQRMLGAKGQARRSVMLFGLDLYRTSCWHWPMRNIYCEYHCATLVCGQETKTGGGPEILCFALKVPL